MNFLTLDHFQITILINNAGVASGYLLLDTPDHLIQRTFDVNVIAHFWVSLERLLLIKKKSVNINIYGKSTLKYICVLFIVSTFHAHLQEELIILGIEF